MLESGAHSPGPAVRAMVDWSEWLATDYIIKLLLRFVDLISLYILKGLKRLIVYL